MNCISSKLFHTLDFGLLLRVEYPSCDYNTVEGPSLLVAGLGVSCENSPFAFRFIALNVVHRGGELNVREEVEVFGVGFEIPLNILLRRMCRVFY